LGNRILAIPACAFFFFLLSPPDHIDQTAQNLKRRGLSRKYLFSSLNDVLPVVFLLETLS